MIKIQLWGYQVLSKLGGEIAIFEKTHLSIHFLLFSRKKYAQIYEGNIHDINKRFSDCKKYFMFSWNYRALCPSPPQGWELIFCAEAFSDVDPDPLRSLFNASPGSGSKGTKTMRKRICSRPLICTLKICKMLLACWPQCQSPRLAWSDFSQY